MRSRVALVNLQEADRSNCLSAMLILSVILMLFI